jgi:hypothetical protein
VRQVRDGHIRAPEDPGDTINVWFGLGTFATRPVKSLGLVQRFKLSPEEAKAILTGE